MVPSLALWAKEAAMGKEAIQWSVGLSWRPWVLSRRVTWNAVPLELVWHRCSTPPEADLVQGEESAKLKALFSTRLCVPLAISFLENKFVSFGFKLNQKKQNFPSFMYRKQSKGKGKEVLYHAEVKLQFGRLQCLKLFTQTQWIENIFPVSFRCWFNRNSWPSLNKTLIYWFDSFLKKL